MKNMTLLLTITLWGCLLKAQDVNPQVRMIRSILQQFDELVAADPGQDEIPEDVAAFVPVYDRLDRHVYETALREIDPFFSLTDLNGGYVEIDGSEIPTNSVTLVFAYHALPGFQNLNGWFELKSVKDASGKNLLLGNKQMDQFMEYGIIDEGFNDPVPGEYSETLWLNRELNWEEPLLIEGTIHLEFPNEYQSVVFLHSDADKTQTVNGVEFTLIGMERHTVTYRQKGDRRNEEGVRPFPLNADDQPFISSESVTIDAEMFDMQSGKARTLSDGEILSSLENFDYSDTRVDQVKRIRVGGPVDKLVLMKVNGTASLEQAFSIAPAVTF